MRSGLQDGAVFNFVNSGSDSFPLLIDLDATNDELAADVFVDVAYGNAAVELDDYDAVMDELDEARQQLEQQREDAVAAQDRFAELKTQAEEEVVHLAEVEKDRVNDEAVQRELERQRAARIAAGSGGGGGDAGRGDAQAAAPGRMRPPVAGASRAAGRRHRLPPHRRVRLGLHRTPDASAEAAAARRRQTGPGPGRGRPTVERRQRHRLPDRRTAVVRRHLGCVALGWAQPRRRRHDVAGRHAAGGRRVGLRRSSRRRVSVATRSGSTVRAAPATSTPTSARGRGRAGRCRRARSSATSATPATPRPTTCTSKCTQAEELRSTRTPTSAPSADGRSFGRREPPDTGVVT